MTVNVNGITITNHSFHVTSHPYRKAHLKSKTRVSSTDCQVFFLQVYSKYNKYTDIIGQIQYIDDI